MPMGRITDCYLCVMSSNNGAIYREREREGERDQQHGADLSCVWCCRLDRWLGGGLVNRTNL